MFVFVVYSVVAIPQGYRAVAAVVVVVVVVVVSNTTN